MTEVVSEIVTLGEKLGGFLRTVLQHLPVRDEATANEFADTIQEFVRAVDDFKKLVDDVKNRTSTDIPAATPAVPVSVPPSVAPVPEPLPIPETMTPAPENHMSDTSTEAAQ